MLRSLFLLVLASLSGCAGFSLTPARGPTHVDRLVKVYPELRSGRFAVLADFEDARHMGIFQLIGVSAGAKCVLDPKGGRTETGGAGLTFSTASAEDTVVVANTDEAEWTLRRDWRAYDLLMMSLYVPVRGLALDLTVGAGPAEKRMSAQSTIALEKGWNILRLDLAEMGELAPLDDVQEMRWSIAGASKTVQVRFDDVLLVGNREDLLGDARDAGGRLYVQRAGRRINVGAGGRFELTFAHGQVTQWHNLAADPNRLVNLVQGTTLGPMPVVVDENGAPAGDFTALGRSVIAGQRLIEANAVRAVVECEWRFVDDPSAPTDNRPFHRWRYTIYPTGQIYVGVQATAKTPSWSPPGLGLAVTLSSPSDRPWQVNVQDFAPATPAEPRLLYAVIRNPSADSAVLVAADCFAGTPRIIAKENEAERRVSVNLLGVGGVDPAVQHWKAHLFLASSSIASDAEVDARAVEYAARRPIHFEIGRPYDLRSFSGGPPNTVLNLAGGCDEVVLDGEQARLVLDGRRRPNYSPAFHVHDTAGQECWVYVDHLIHEGTARDADGDLIFQLPGVITKSTIIEVLSKAATGPTNRPKRR